MAKTCHSTSGEVVRDIVIGMSDRLTVPFARAVGPSGAVYPSHVVMTAGLAEIAAGSIAMGIGGFLGARGDLDHYDAERKREKRQVIEMPDEETAEVVKVFQDYGWNKNEAKAIADSLEQ